VPRLDSSRGIEASGSTALARKNNIYIVSRGI
jgi:hypothetical protein